MPGGIKQFANNQTTYNKWVLNRPHLAKFKDGLLQMTGLTQKTCRPSEIIKSEQRMAAVLVSLEEEFLNPFASNMDSQRLYNLSSGAPVEQGVADSMINVVEHSTHKYNEFVSERLESGHKQLFAQIPRSQLKTFRDSNKKGDS